MYCYKSLSIELGLYDMWFKVIKTLTLTKAEQQINYPTPDTLTYRVSHPAKMPSSLN